MLAISKSGHDKGKIYYVSGDDGKRLYLSDGKKRPLSSPKIKNRKHVELINDPASPDNDEDIKRLIKEAKRLRTAKEETDV